MDCYICVLTFVICDMCQSYELTVFNSISKENQTHWDNSGCEVVVLQLRLYKSFQGFKIQQIFIHMWLLQEVPYKQKTNRTPSNSNELIGQAINQANNQIT